MYLTSDQVFVFTVLVAALALFVWGRWRYDVVALGALLAVVFRGLVAADEAFAGFAHPAVTTVASVLVLSKGLLNAGVVAAIASWLGRVGGGPPVQVVVLTSLVAICSGFMNNVGALALLMPVAVWMARRGGYSPSRLLMPLAFGSLLGGMTTLIGTPPNIIVASSRAAAGHPPFGMFAFLPVGAGVLLAGVLLIGLLGGWLVPERITAASKEGLFAIEEYLSEVRIPAASRMVGETLHRLETSVGDAAEVAVVGLVRKRKKTMVPSSYTVLQAEDILLVEAHPDDLKTLLETAKLELAESKDVGQGALNSDDVSIIEAVVLQNSPLVGTTAAAIDLRRRFGVNLLAVARHGQRLRERLSHIRFVIGDILLLQGGKEALQASMSQLGCLPLADRGLEFGRPRRMLLAVGTFIAGLAATASGLAPVQIALTTAALVMLLSGILTLREAYEAIDWPILILLGAMMPVGYAFESTGAAQLLAGQVATVSDWGGIPIVLPVLIVATMLLSNVVNNAAAAVLMAPIALRVAGSLNISADPLLMGVAVGASAAFLTPIGHQSNTLVMEPGGYRFGDYWRLGLPVSIALVLVATPLILWAWPL
ncbi:MAG TPA: SLC13 family permease [Candidatus Tectomicrobia bacterium]|nr:SLC13 family permease [Candidatus Tectomicrobia bacterium]